MAINVGAAFKRTSANPIDETQVLSKAEMLAVDDNLMPEKYFCVCKDDGKMYTYDKSATPNAETGKFTVVGGGAVDQTYAAASTNAQSGTAVAEAIATKQDTLVSGTNIKTINGQNVLGSGNVIIHQGVGDSLDINDMPYATEVTQMIEDHALLYIDGNWLITGYGVEDETYSIFAGWGDYERQYNFINLSGGYEPLEFRDYTETRVEYPHINVVAAATPYALFYRGEYNSEIDRFQVWGGEDKITLVFKDKNGYNQTKAYVISPSYELCNNDTGGNVIQTGSITIDGTKYGLFQFFYKTSALPNTNMQEYSFANLLADYTIKDFIDGTGMTSNGIFIGCGRTDGTNRAVIQQFSKNNKKVQIRTYQDFSQQTATIKIQFIGKKNT